LKDHSGTVEALDEGSMNAVIMLDITAASDVIDHPILLRLLVFSFGTKKGFNLIKVVTHRHNSVCFSSI